MSDDSIGRKFTKITLNGTVLELHYGIASIYYLTKKYNKDIREIFSVFTDSSPIDSNFFGLLSDVIYAGLFRPDADGNDTSGHSSFEIMSMMDIDDIPAVMQAVGAAIEASQPKVKATDPTSAPKKGAKAQSGTGTTSTQPRE